jgi:DNA-binding Lrp family transcriptional regulator
VIRVDEKSFDKVVDTLTGLDCISDLYEMKEGYDLMVKVHADTQKRLEKAIVDILNIGGVQSTYNFLAIQQKKGNKMR